MRRRALLWLAGVALVIGALLTDRLLWEPGLTEDNVRRLRPGVTLAEVEALLGGPATDTVDLQDPVEPISPLRVRWQRKWRDGAAWAEAQFPAASARVKGKCNRRRARIARVAPAWRRCSSAVARG